MIIIMNIDAAEVEIKAVIDRVETVGFKTHISKGEERTIIGIIGDERKLNPGSLHRQPSRYRAVTGSGMLSPSSFLPT